MNQPVMGQPAMGQPAFIIQTQQPGQSGWDKGMGYAKSCGKFVGLSSGVVCAIIIVILCAVGIMFYRKKSTVVYNTVQATVLEANCSQVVNNTGKSRSVSYNCALKVKYTINDVSYENTLMTNDTVYNVNQIMTIYYNTQDPNDIKASYITNQNLGKILIGVGSSFVLLLIIHIVLTMKSEWYNRLQCFGAVSSTVSSAFR